ncbi:MAG TPA: hypothetical protein VFX96_12305 [Pyrinomonadaceae bacterium]|nr:hypothetical protein [Pyrinomonadaceae bacterium]
MSEAGDNLPDGRGVGSERAGGLPDVVRRVGIYLGAGLVIFLLGFVPMWLRSRDNANQRDAARRELRVSQMQNTLASAAVDAQRGEYEPARQAASDFFTALREQVDGVAAEGVALTQTQREALRPLHAQRDEVITLLARSDPAASARLLDIFVAFRKAVSSVPPEGKRE